MRWLLIVVVGVGLFAAGYALATATKAEPMIPQSDDTSRVHCTPYSDPGVPCIDDDTRVP